MKHDILVEHISKQYKNTEKLALKDISFNVEEAELFGLIGPDGAGKTSLFRILTTMILPTSGKASVLGFDVINQFKEIRNIIGYMPGKFSLYLDLTVEENLNFFAGLFNTTLTANYDLIKDIYQFLEPFKNRRAGQLSGGMKQKLALCCALIHRPKVLFLDEPTTGVDAVSRKEFWDMLKRLKKMGITILVSTPYMDEATMCERIALIQDGELLSINTPKMISKEFPTRLYAVKADQMSVLLKDLRMQSLIRSCHTFGDKHHISFTDKSDQNKAAFNEAMMLKHSGYSFTEIEPTIEDCFIELMKS